MSFKQELFFYAAFVLLMLAVMIVCAQFVQASTCTNYVIDGNVYVCCTLNNDVICS